jgi:uncharacterized protein with PQ loop repeat
MSAYSHGKHRKNKKRIGYKPTAIDSWIYVAVIVGPILTIPQVYSIWILHQKGVSPISWAAYLFADVIWLLYGLKRRDKPIIFVQLAWIALSLLILVGLYEY